MLPRLIQFALTQRMFMLLLVALIAGSGWYAFQHTPIDAFPDVSTTQVKVIVKAPGMTPEEVETRITAPIEVEMLGIPRQSMLRSIAKYALTDITVDFSEGTDIYWARQQVAERLNAVWGDLPADISGGIAPMTTPLGEMFMFTIEGGELDNMARRELLDWVIRPALRSVTGVADVNALGGLVRSYEVIPDTSRMSVLGVTLDMLREALAENNRNDGAGRLVDGDEVLLVRTEGSIRNLADVGSIVVRADRHQPVRVRDIADVRIGALTRYGAVSRNGGEETVEGLVLGLRGANAREVVQGVLAKLEELKPALPPGVEIKVFYNRGQLVDKAVGTVTGALMEAIILVLILLVLFLGDLRAALTVALILPLAALATFILMYRFGMSANLMSLGGLAIAVGMLVDAAVVVVENVVTHLAHRGAASRLPRLHLIYRASREVAVPVTSGVLIIIIVFLPLLTLQGLEGKLFIPVALTIVFALGASLLLSLSVIPVLASYLLGKVAHEDPRLVRMLLRFYRPALTWALAHTRTVTVAAVSLLLLAGLIYTQIGKSFMPTMDEGDLIVQLEKLPSINLQESVNIDMRVQLKPREQWSVRDKDELVAAIRTVLDDFPGVGYTFTQPIEMRVSEMLTGVRGDLAIKVFGSNQDELNATADRMVEIVRKVPGAQDVYTPRNEGAQYYRLVADRMTTGRLGVSMDTLERDLRSLIEGERVGTVYEDIRRVPLLLRGSGELRNSAQQFSNIRLSIPTGDAIGLEELVTLERMEGPVAIKRERGNRMAVVIANVSGRDLVSFVEAAKQAVASELALPAGYYLEWGGQFENQQRAAKRLSIVVPVALGLIFLTLFSTFHSVRQSVLVLANIPFALIGGVIALWLSGEYLSVPASVGFIALLGIAVLNGVVMVTYFNQLLATGRPVAEVVVLGALRRLRPVLMTASIAAFGLVPLLFAQGPGSEIQRPLAIVVIGGLLSSTLLTLFLLPILYRRYGVAASGA
jgi:cobalt-zinc-cadmium resistance protein CzcA